jgi:site-specific DNA-methyltransferase (adenine-specific)/modification methylase
MELNKIWNESNEITMKEHIDEKSIDIILTSPPYNSCNSHAKCMSENTIQHRERKYDIYIDIRNSEEYCNWINSIFNDFDKVLKPNGVVLWNVSYGNDVTNTDMSNIGLMWNSIVSIIKNTPFEIADKITWKKKSALPNNVSPNKLTRMTEDIFVFCRKSEIKTFYCNKKIKNVGKNEQNYYENIFNFIEADNNDEVCPLNKATFSSDLCKKLLKIYAPHEGIVYDPFMGTGTTAVACKKMNLNYIGSEISSKQCEWAENRIKNGKGARNEDLNKLDLFDL